MAAKRKTARRAEKPKPAIANKQTKSQIVGTIADETGMTKKDVSAVFGALGEVITRHMKKRGSGEITIPDTGIKVRRVKKPARKARMGRNPFTGEEIKIAAKPASVGVKVTALKSLKETVKH